jgi:hypothetical protein
MTGISNGGWSNFKVTKGALIEYTNATSPLELYFDFNPASMTRNRTVTIRTGGAPGTAGGYDFKDESQIPRASQGVTTNPETLTVKILLDATDRMNAGDEVALEYGVQPEIDTLRTMLEPKLQTPKGAQTLAALQQGEARAFSRHQFASVLLFKWGDIELPVFMTQAQVEIKEYFPNLFPYRAEATLTLQVIESQNPFYPTEMKRQAASASKYSGTI